jgi:serine/threonine protein kinase
MTLSAGSKVGPYEILAPLGAGGMGEVYRARDPRLGREVAIKVLPASFSNDPDRLRRFEQEARAAGIRNHPNITAVYDVGSFEQAPYVVTELLEGETLRSRMAGGALAPRRAIDYALQIAHGLAAAHSKGIVHRDLKPENLFVTKEGRVKILDFGLAKLTQPESVLSQTNLPTAALSTEPGVVMGTLGYMSPEQVRGRASDARSDIFSFGAVLYEMLSGHRAFRGDSAADTMSAILREDPPVRSTTNRSIAPGLDRIVRHCLEKDPEARFHSAHDLAFHLEALSDPSGTGTEALPAPRPRKVLTKPAFVALAVFALLIAPAA